MNTEDFTLRFLRARVAKGLTQGQLAQRAGVSRQSVNYWENGNAHPREPALKAVAEALDVPPGWLLYGRPEGLVL